MHEYSSSMHIKKLKIAHYPTRKFVQINELCSHFHSQKRKKKEKEVRKSRTSIFAFRKEDSSRILSSRRGGKVK